MIYSEQSELCRKLCFGSFHVLWQTVSSASFVPFCPILSSLISLSLSHSVAVYGLSGGVWIGTQGLAFRGRNSRFSELSTAGVSLVDLERTSDCAGSLFHFLISGSGSNQS